MSVRVDPTVATAFDQVLAVVCAELGVDLAAARAHRSWPVAGGNRAWLAVADCRRIALYVTRMICDVPGAALARAVGLTPAAVAIASHTVEDCRTDPDFDALLDRLDEAVRPLFRSGGSRV